MSEFDDIRTRLFAVPTKTVRVLRLNEALAAQLSLLAIMGAGAFLRLWQLNVVGYNSDEAVYAGQAAAIVQDPVLKEFFPVFRAHPLLFHFLLALQFQFGVNDLAGRLTAVAFGLATIYLVYRLGSLLYGQRAGLLGALLLALMPYHVVVSRQVLLDGPMVTCATLTFYCLAQYGQTHRPGWLYAAGASMGLTFNMKETGIVLLGSIFAWLALCPQVPLRIRDLVIAVVIMALVIAPFPLTLLLAGGSSTGQQYLIWQLFRRSNHTWDFYPATVPLAMGPLTVAAALAGAWLLRRQASWRETLLLAWIVVPVVFFQLWPVKGYQYLLPVAPAIALLAARTLTHWSPPRAIRAFARRIELRRVWIGTLIVVPLALLVSSWFQIQVRLSDEFTAGTGGIPRARELGAWLDANAPRGSQLLTIGPSMANIVMFYGHRAAFGLSVSPNALHRNPSYVPIYNPDMQIRNSQLQYVVWDSFSAARSPFFSERLLGYAKKYNGRVVHSETISVTTPTGETAETPVMIVYEVRPSVGGHND